MTGLVLPIQTQRLLLRAHRPDDLDALLSYYSNPEVVRYTPFQPWTRESGQEQIAKRVKRTGIESGESGLGLLVEHEGKVVGDVMIWPADDTLRRGEMGWALHPSATGRGYATEAVRALIGVAFGVYGMHRVFARIDARNSASAKVCRRLGMRKEAHLRQDYWSKDEWSDTIVYGLLAGDLDDLG